MGARFRLVAPEPSELELHTSCARALDALLLPPARWCTYPAGHIQLPPQAAAKLFRVGLKRSYPDILIFYGQTYGIELKRSDGRLSRTRIIRTRSGAPRMVVGQEEMFPKLLETGAFGGIAVVLISVAVRKKQQ